MADPDVNVNIKATDNTAPGIDSAQGKFDTFKSNTEDGLGELGKMIAEVFAAEKIKDFFEEGITSFAEFDKQLDITQANLERMGKGTADSKKQIAEWADGIQAATLYTKDQAVVTLNQFVAATNDLGASLKLSSVAMDVATGSGIDLQEVTTALSRAYQGHTEGLTRFSTKIQGLKEVLDNNGDAIAFLEKRYAGFAKTLGNEGVAGDLFHLKDAWDNVTEDFARDNEGTIKDSIIGFHALATAVRYVLEAFLKLGETIGVVFGADFDIISAFVERAIAGFRAVGLAISGHPIEAYHEWKNANTVAFNEILATAKGAVTQLKDIWSKGLSDAGLPAPSGAALSRPGGAPTAGGKSPEVTEHEKSQDQIQAKDEETAKKKKGLLDDVLSYESIIQNLLQTMVDAGNKKYIDALKVARIAQATMNLYSAESAALADYPYPASLAVAAAVGVEGGLEIAQIAGVALAEGGVATGPTLATIGEGGEPEAVVPLSKAGSMGFGGGETHTHFHFPGVTDRHEARIAGESAGLAFMRTQQGMKTRSGNRNTGF